MFEKMFEVLGAGKLPLDAPVYPYLLRSGITTGLRGREGANAMAFHFACWAVANGVTNFRMMHDISQQPSPMININGQPIWILFGDKDERDQFEAWLAIYKTWFIVRPMDQCLFPDLPISGFYSLRFLSKNIGYDIAMDDYAADSFATWVMIVQHCKSPVFVTQNALAFVDEKEALLYKLDA